MASKNVKIWYDAEGDYLEVKVTAGGPKPTQGQGSFRVTFRW